MLLAPVGVATKGAYGAVRVHSGGLQGVLGSEGFRVEASGWAGTVRSCQG